MDVKGKIALKLFKAAIRRSPATKKISDSMTNVYTILKNQPLFDQSKEELSKQLGLKDFIEMNFIMMNGSNEEKIKLATKMYDYFFRK